MKTQSQVVLAEFYHPGGMVGYVSAGEWPKTAYAQMEIKAPKDTWAEVPGMAQEEPGMAHAVLPPGQYRVSFVGPEDADVEFSYLR